jgi:DNA-binding MarR family transcriptional regulator
MIIEQMKIHEYIENLPNDSILAIGSLTKRLTDILFTQVQDLYTKRGHDFKPVWFSFLLALKKADGLDLKSLAAKRGVSPSAASQVVKELERKGLATTVTNKTDSRFIFIQITEKGIHALNDLVPELKLLEDVFTELLGPDKDLILNRLSFFEQQLKRKAIHERLSSSIKIKPYSSNFQEQFKELNREWLSELFELTAYDNEQLANPEHSILAQGGQILLACDESELLGTIALLHHSDQACEISKMTVAKNYRGQNIGKLLLESIINQAKQKSYGYIILYANSKLESAIHLYEKFGFYRVPIDSEGDKYGSRCNLAYRMDL